MLVKAAMIFFSFLIFEKTFFFMLLKQQPILALIYLFEILIKFERILYVNFFDPVWEQFEVFEIASKAGIGFYMFKVKKYFNMFRKSSKCFSFLETSFALNAIIFYPH